MSLEKLIAEIKSLHNEMNYIPLHVPVFKGNERAYVNDAIDSTFVSSVGSYVDRFEEMMAECTQTTKTAAVVNGTAALEVALRLVGASSGTEVITQGLTFVATCNAIAYNNAIPIFVDVDLDTMGMSPLALSSFLEEYGELREDGCYNKVSGRKIAACMPMHTFGFMCRMDEIVEICNQWMIALVEDAAEALGSQYMGKSAGSFGQLGAFSFNGNKIITAGGGGAVVSKYSELAIKAKHLTTTAKIPHAWEYVHDELGYNYRMPNLNAALLCAQLEQLDRMKLAKKALYSDYGVLFNDHSIQLKPVPAGTSWNYWLMSVELEDMKERDAFLKETNANGVMTRPIWRLMFRLPMYENCMKDTQQNATYLEHRIVNIPSSARL